MAIGLFCVPAQIGFHESRARLDRDYYQDILNNAKKVAVTCERIATQEGSPKMFAKQLADYLRKRTQEVPIFSDNIREIEKRTRFVEQLLTHIQSGDLNQQLAMLAEKNISTFKGFFSQRLYDILVAQRSRLQEQELASVNRRFYR